MAKKNKKAKKKTTTKKKNTALAKALKTAATAAKSVATSNKTYRSTQKSSSAKSLANQGVSAVSNAAAKQAAALAEAKRKQEQKKAAANKAASSSMKNTKARQQRGGVVLSSNRNQRQKSAAEARANLLKATGAEKKTTAKSSNPKSKVNTDDKYKKAIKESKERTALGTKKQKETKTYKTGYGVNNSLIKGGNAVTGAKIIGDLAADATKQLRDAGFSDKEIKSKEGKQLVNDYLADARKAVTQEVKRANRKVNKSHPSEIKYSYEGMTQQEYNKLATGAQQGRLDDILKSDKDLAKKVANLNVKDYVDGAFSMGALDQMTQGLSVSQNPVYNYSDAQKAIMERQKTKKGTGYNAGRFAGAVVEFGLGGTGSLGSAIAKTTGKVALKEAAKGGIKNLLKTMGKNAAKETMGDTVASLGLNTLDALKFSYKDGKFDKKEFAKELALNVRGDLLIGGTVSGITHGLSARQVSNFNRINKALNSGKTVSDAEIKFYNKHLNELGDKVEAAVKAQESTQAANVNYEVNKYGAADVRKQNISEQPMSLDAIYKTSTIKETDVSTTHKEVFEQYQNGTNPKLVKYANDVLEGNETPKTATLGHVDEKTAQRISDITGIDAKGFEHIIGANDISHIEKRHGKNGKHDNSMADINDVGRIGYIIENADVIYRTVDENGKPVGASGYVDANKNAAPQITYEKRVDGHVYVVESVIDAKHGKLRVTSAYMNKVGEGKKIESPQTVSAGDSPLYLTSETESGSLSINNISNSTQNVNIKEAELTAAEVYVKATKEQQALDSTLKSIADEMGAKVETGSPKSVQSMIDKMSRKLVEGKEYDLYTMKDHARNKVELNSFEQIPEFLTRLDAKGIKYDTELVETQLGYKGFHVTYRNVDGIGAEIQLTTPQAWAAKLKSDEIYHKWRNINVDDMDEAMKLEYQADATKSRQLWAAVDTSNLGNFATSSAGNVRASMTSPNSMSLAGTQAPSTSSISENASSMRPSSVLQNDNSIVNSPSSDSIGSISQKTTGEKSGFVDSSQNVNPKTIEERSEEIHELFKGSKEFSPYKRSGKYDGWSYVINSRYTGDVSITWWKGKEKHQKVLPEYTSNASALWEFTDFLAERELGTQNVNPKEAELEANSGTTFKAYSDPVIANPGKQYNTVAEQIKADNPPPDEAFRDAQRISPDEVPQARQTAVKMANQVDDDVADIIEPWIREGYANKKVLQSQEEAIQQAQKELADGRLYDNFLESKVESDEHLFMARAKVLLEDLMKKAPENNEAAEMLLNVMDKATEASSHAGRLMNATKLLLRNTPQGRARIFTKEIDRLNKKFASRLKNGELKLTPEQEQRILNATDDTIEEVAEQINKEIWEDIPATWFEKFNEIRHTSMLFNAKTHIRNVTGNAVFWQARLVSDGMEIAINKIPAVKNRIEKLGGKTEMVHVTRKELSDNKDILNEIFEQNYQKSGSKNRYIEASRPDGAPIVKNRTGNWLIQTNYKLLEKEDLLTFKPEYRKNFIRWCKANDVPLDDIPNLTKEQMQKADAYAIRQAERATFRDNSAFASKIVGLKQKTAGAQGKTVLGTAAYRAANVALESNLPFVKTPVNILRRSVDYSPLGLARSAVELATAKSADDFMQGVHHLATGLTGSGVFALGMWLANNDLITVKAGEESGDAYYDRDMGYQDYSLLLNFDGKQYSMTIDWLSPMQVSLFMGAEVWNKKNDGGYTFEDMCDGLVGMFAPMLDMSFMSSAKDTIEMFMEKVYRNGTSDDADWSGAIMKTLFGSVPQGYLNSFVPQVLSQTAQAFDSKQRDTRSTKEDPVAASWESWSRKMINKIPGLRNKLLNPKLDRFGDDKVTGNNIVTRFLNAYLNPSNVKRIDFTKEDKEVIKIYNSLPEGSYEKETYYLMFTGNPDYELGNGKRMTYDEAYTYGKENRRQQTRLIDDMINSKSYKNMTWEMKYAEVDGSHSIGQTYADRKTYGNNYARNQIIRNGSETDQRAAKLSKDAGINSKDYVDFYLTKEKLINRSHDSSYQTKALSVALFGNDSMAKIYDINMDKVKVAKEYLNNGGSQKEYSNAMCNVMSGINKADVSDSLSNKAVSAASFKINERTYLAMGIDDQKANMGVGLKNFGYTFAMLEQMRMDSKYGFDLDGSGSLTKPELMAYIDSLGLSSREEKACVFAYFSNANNPYGNVPNYLGFGNVTSSSGGSGRSYGRSSGRSSSKTTTEKVAKNNLPSWEDYVKDFITESERVSGVNFNDWDSPLDQSYRNKINSILKKMDA